MHAADVDLDEEVHTELRENPDKAADAELDNNRVRMGEQGIGLDLGLHKREKGGG